MSCANTSPFDRIEAALEYLTLLSGTVAENRQKVDAEVMAAADHTLKRRLEVLAVVAYNLEKLERHLKASRQTLGNLRKLRRVLLNEGAGKGTDQEKTDELSRMEITSSAGV